MRDDPVPCFAHIGVVRHGGSDGMSVVGCMMQSADVKVDTKPYAPLLKCASGKDRAAVANQLQCEGSVPLCLFESNFVVGE